MAKRMQGQFDLLTTWNQSLLYVDRSRKSKTNPNWYYNSILKQWSIRRNIHGWALLGMKNSYKILFCKNSKNLYNLKNKQCRFQAAQIKMV